VRFPVCITTLVLLLAACSSSGPQPAPDVIAAPGYQAFVYATDFDGPTQMVFAPNGDLLVAELQGGENDGTGRIVRVDRQDPTARSVLQTDLDKPTGIAVVGDLLWIMERRQLSVTSLEPGAARQVVLEDMPFNGRSQGTLTVTPRGQLLFDTSGSKRGADRVAGSGTLFAISSAADGFSQPEVVATGFKHAYAHVVDPDGQLWTVEMTDGTFDGERAPDELVAIAPGDDGGWPQCFGNNRPALEFGGTQAGCAASPPSHAIFGLGATPTSIVLAPWGDDEFVVALWLPGQVVTVPRQQPGSEPHEPVVLLEGIESPQHLLVLDEQLLVSDHETGQIFSVTKAS